MIQLIKIKNIHLRKRINLRDKVTPQNFIEEGDNYLNKIVIKL